MPEVCSTALKYQHILLMGMDGIKVLRTIYPTAPIPGSTSIGLTNN